MNAAINKSFDIYSGRKYNNLSRIGGGNEGGNMFETPNSSNRKRLN
jgi:hypothetical protein